MNSNKTTVRARVDVSLDHLSVAMPAVAVVRHLGDQVLVRARSGNRDSGASAIEWVLIMAIAISIVLAVGATLYTKLTNKATNLDLTTP